MKKATIATNTAHMLKEGNTLKITGVNKDNTSFTRSMRDSNIDIGVTESRSEKHYPKFPKNKRDYHERLDTERELGYEDGLQDGKLQGRLHAERTYTEQGRLTRRRGAEIASNCLVIFSDRQNTDAAAMAKMMYAAFKILELSR